MKIYQITNDHERLHVAANTAVQALRLFVALDSNTLNDLHDEHDVVEIDRLLWPQWMIKDEDGNNMMSFADWMRKNDTPAIIATSLPSR